MALDCQRQPQRSLPHLPNEIIVMIVRELAMDSYLPPTPDMDPAQFECLSATLIQRVIASLCYVCQSWKPIARFELFKKVTLLSNAAVNLLFRTLEESQECRELASSTKGITLALNRYGGDSGEDFLMKLARRFYSVNELLVIGNSPDLSRLMPFNLETLRLHNVMMKLANPTSFLLPHLTSLHLSSCICFVAPNINSSLPQLRNLTVVGERIRPDPYSTVPLFLLNQMCEGSADSFALFYCAIPSHEWPIPVRKLDRLLGGMGLAMEMRGPFNRLKVKEVYYRVDDYELSPVQELVIMAYFVKSKLELGVLTKLVYDERGWKKGMVLFLEEYQSERKKQIALLEMLGIEVIVLSEGDEDLEEWDDLKVW